MRKVWTDHMIIIAPMANTLRQLCAKMGISYHQANSNLIFLLKKSIKENSSQGSKGLLSRQNQLETICEELYKLGEQSYLQVLASFIGKMQIEIRRIQSLNTLQKNQEDSRVIISESNQISSVNDDDSEDKERMSEIQNSTEESLRRKESLQMSSVSISIRNLMLKTKLLKEILSKQIPDDSEEIIFPELFPFRSTSFQSSIPSKINSI